MDEIRTLRLEEMDESLDLSCFAFQYELAPDERAARKAHTTPDTIWGYFVEGRLAAKMTIHPMHTYVGGRLLAMGGVAGVATWPEYRRQGLVHQLLVNALKVMKEQGQSVSFLHPFSIPFYRKFGWELYADYMEVELDASQLPSGPASEGYVERVAKDWTLLHPLYSAYAAGYNGMLARDEAWWSQKVFKRNSGQAVLYRKASGEAAGYLLYEVKNKQLKIGEFVALDLDAWHGLWRFIANHDSMFDRITLRAPVDDPLSFLLFNPRVKRKIEPYFMARIVDVAAFVNQMAFAGTGRPVNLLLQVEDEHADWNNGTFELEVEPDGKVRVAQREGTGGMSGRTEAAVKCRVSTLTAMLMGYKRPTELHRYGLLAAEVETVELLEQLLPRRSTYLADYF